MISGLVVHTHLSFVGCEVVSLSITNVICATLSLFMKLTPFLFLEKLRSTCKIDSVQVYSSKAVKLPLLPIVYGFPF